MLNLFLYLALLSVQPQPAKQPRDFGRPGFTRYCVIRVDKAGQTYEVCSGRPK